MDSLWLPAGIVLVLLALSVYYLVQIEKIELKKESDT